MRAGFGAVEPFLVGLMGAGLFGAGELGFMPRDYGGTQTNWPLMTRMSPAQRPSPNEGGIHRDAVAVGSGR